MKSNNNLVFKIQEYISQKNTFGKVLIFVITIIVSGIVGNYAYDWSKATAIPWLSTEVDINNFAVVMFVLLGLICGTVAAVLFLDQIIKPTALHAFSTIKELNAHKMILYWVMMNNINVAIQHALVKKTEKTLEKLTDDFFNILFRYLDAKSVRGGVIFIRDTNDPDYLHVWRVSPYKHQSKKRFYVGKSPAEGGVSHKRGAAGCVFIENKARIVNIMDQRSGKTDDPKYYRFDFEKPIVPYACFVAFPIHWGNDVAGVLSIESLETHSFSSDDILWLQPIADRLGNILFHFGKI